MPKAQLTRLELQIMQVLWNNGASTVQAVQQRLPGDPLAYTTVQTMLNILQRKGKVKRKLLGKAFEYRPVLSRDKALREATSDMLDRMFGGSVEALLMVWSRAVGWTRTSLPEYRNSSRARSRRTRRNSMAQTSQLVATFILNATWQITAITALALLCTKLLHRAPSRFSHGVWIAALGACLLIPTATVVLQHRGSHWPRVRGYPN